jgi:hypothetical protein
MGDMNEVFGGDAAIDAAELRLTVGVGNQMLRNNRNIDPSMRLPPTKSSDVEIENQSQLVSVFCIAAERELSAFSHRCE